MTKDKDLDQAKESKEKKQDQVKEGLEKGQLKEEKAEERIEDKAEETKEKDLVENKESLEETKKMDLADLNKENTEEEKKKDQVKEDIDKSKDISDQKGQKASQDKAVEKKEKSDEGWLSSFLAVLGNVVFALFLIAIAGIIAINTIYFARGEDLSIFGKRMFIVGEDTMAPILKENDAIIVKDTSPKDLKQGDLIVYENSQGDYITSWINQIYEDDSYEIKKDINSDESIKIDGIAIVGRAETSIANMGDFIDFISNPVSILIIFFVGIIIYIGVWLITNRKKQSI